jgi:hypothetical protein
MRLGNEAFWRAAAGGIALTSFFAREGIAVLVVHDRCATGLLRA